MDRTGAPLGRAPATLHVSNFGGYLCYVQVSWPPFSFSWYKIHCNLVLWNTLNSKTEKKHKKNFHSGSFRKFICLVMQSSVGYLLQVQNRKRRRVEKSLGKLHFAGDLEAFACAGWKWFTLATLYRAARFTPRVPGRLEAVGWAGIRQIAEAFQ